MLKNLRLPLEILADAAFPPRCAGWPEVSGCEGWSHETFCHFCAGTLQRVDAPFCLCCGEPLPPNVHAADVCPNCRDNRYHPAPPFDAARSVYLFDEAIRSGIHRLKYAGKTALTARLAPYLAKVWDQPDDDFVPPQQVDIVVPVPLHAWRRWRRGYNQSELLARELALLLNRPCVDLLERTRFVPPQVGLAREERLKNVRNVFGLKTGKTSAIKDATVLLIDDVYTTGATMKECARVLKKGGAKRVYALTLARQPK